MKFIKFANPFHPGEILLEEFLRPKNMSQREFAKQLSWSTRKLNEIVKGKRGISAFTAIDLAKALGTTPEYWLNLQRTWDLAAAYKQLAA